MTDQQREWQTARDGLVRAVESLGFPGVFGEVLAGQLKSPRAIARMTAYLYNEKPRSEEVVVDEMLAICSEIEAWREKKASQEANSRYNEILYYGLGNDDDNE